MCWLHSLHTPPIVPTLEEENNYNTHWNDTKPAAGDLMTNPWVVWWSRDTSLATSRAYQQVIGNATEKARFVFWKENALQQ